MVCERALLGMLLFTYLFWEDWDQTQSQHMLDTCSATEPHPAPEKCFYCTNDFVAAYMAGAALVTKYLGLEGLVQVLILLGPGGWGPRPRWGSSPWPADTILSCILSGSFLCVCLRPPLISNR
jgi:hypothetical protein